MRPSTADRLCRALDEIDATYRMCGTDDDPTICCNPLDMVAAAACAARDLAFSVATADDVRGAVTPEQADAARTALADFVSDLRELKLVGNIR